MGAAVVRQLEPLGAEIHVIDLKEPPIEVAGYHPTDLQDPDAIAAAVDAHRGPDRRPVQLRRTARWAVLGPRHHAGQLRRPTPSGRSGGRAHGTEGGAIASISSGAGASWMANVEKWKPLVTTEGFAAGRQWLEDHPEEIASGYAPSKEVIIVWTVWRSLALAEQGHPDQLHASRARPTRR